MLTYDITEFIQYIFSRSEFLFETGWEGKFLLVRGDGRIKQR